MCGEPGGFHDHVKHAEHQVPADLLVESGWYKAEHERISKELAEVRRQADLNKIKKATVIDHLVAASSLLLALKDGPRDEHYEAAKPLAWEELRIVLQKLEQIERTIAEPETRVHRGRPQKQP